VVKEATHYQADCFLLEVSSEETWQFVLIKCSRTHLGPPDHLRMNQGSNLMVRESIKKAEEDEIQLLEHPCSFLLQ
jgi:hypothetical protein